MNKSLAHRIEDLKRQNLWNDVPEYPRSDWRYQVGNGDTNLGYWDWVEHQLEADNNDAL
jgi:hypothetical protein